MATTSAAPNRIPDFALQSAAVYRLEVGAAFFVAFYLVAMALVLAFSGRGFAELGPRGLRARDLSGQQRQLGAWDQQEELNEFLQGQMEALQGDLENADKRFTMHGERLDRLEGENEV